MKYEMRWLIDDIRNRRDKKWEIEEIKTRNEQYKIKNTKG